MASDEAKRMGAPQRPAAVPMVQPEPVAVLTTIELFGGATEIAISHDDVIYRLRITRQGKLILNK